VEPGPSIETIKRGAQVALQYQPDWIIGLDDGSAMDATKTIRVSYARKEVQVIAPISQSYWLTTERVGPGNLGFKD